MESRFPGFSVTRQAPHWDDATRRVVLGRLEPTGEPRHFSPEEITTLAALVGRLVDVPADLARHLAGAIDTRVADGQTDGWHYDDMPVDEEVWQRSLAALDEAAGEDGRFAALDAARQHELLSAIADGDDAHWHGMPRAHLWNLWMRYACTAYYAHPAAWDEMGWPGPAYPRGYKNLGVNRREPFEVADAEPDFDPTRQGNA